MSKISDLPLAGPITGAETLPVVQDGTTKRAIISAFLASTAETAIAPLVAQVEDAVESTANDKDAAQAASGLAQAAAASTALDKIAVAADRAAVQTAAAGAAASQTAAATSAAQAATDRGVVAGLVTTAQAMNLGTYVDANRNTLLGPAGTAAGPLADNVIIGQANGMGGEKGFYAGADAGKGSLAYSSQFIGWYTGARFIGDFSVGMGTHSLQDTNVVGFEFPGIGTAATGSITFNAVPPDGEPVEVNGVTFTARSAPALANEFARGATAAEAAQNLLVALLASTSAPVARAFYRRASASAVSVLVRSTSQGTAGNSFTLAATGAAISVSGATLAGGAAVVGNGNRLNTAGETAVGWYAGADMQRPAAGRRGQITLAFSGVPEEGAAIALGFNLTSANTAFFRSAPVGALDIARGASRAEALANATAVLNGSANGTVTASTYWASPTGLFIETNAVGVQTFEVRPFATSVITSPQNAGAGAFAAFGTMGNTALGFQTAGFCYGHSNVIAAGGGSTSGVSNILLGSAGIQGNFNIVMSPAGFNYTEGDNNIALGSDITNGTAGPWQAIAGISPNGVITFVDPHGWTQGRWYSVQYRDRTGGTSRLQRVPQGQMAGQTPGTPVTLATAVGGMVLLAINATQALIQRRAGPTTGLRDDGYQALGTVTDIDIARFVQLVEHSITIGGGATAANRRATIGSRRQTEGLLVGAVGMQLARGELRLPFIIPGTPASGSILFPTASGNFADNATVTLNTTAFTFRTAANFATPNNAMGRWVRIGADMWESLNNLLACIRNSDDQTTAARAVPLGRFFLTSTTGGGWRLNFQSFEFGGTAYTLATSHPGATVTAPGVGGLGNLPTSASIYPPRDGGLIQLTASPANNGQPGLARYRASTNSWLALAA